MKWGLLLLFTLQVFAGVYTPPKKYAEFTVTINAPIDEVWEYNSNNAHAREWSVYFYKIVECPIQDCPDNAGLAPSDIGYTRRSFRNEDETGVYWDETTTVIEKSEDKFYKQIRAFNFNGYSEFAKFNEKGEFLVEQFFKKVDANTTKLTFRSGLIKRKELAKRTNLLQYFGWKAVFKFYTHDSIKETFRQNLINIKHAIEKGDTYQIVYPYDNTTLK